jgi:hypothetical protein
MFLGFISRFFEGSAGFVKPRGELQQSNENVAYVRGFKKDRIVRSRAEWDESITGPTQETEGAKRQRAEEK